MARFTGKLDRKDEPTPIYDKVRDKARETPIHDEVKTEVEEQEK